ncbi:MAG: hypothetical protein WAT66_14650 [Actinomycetota bacterium]
MQVEANQVSDVFEFMGRRIAKLAQECAVLEAKLASAEREMAEVREMARRVTAEAELQRMATGGSFEPQSQATDSADSG